MRKVFYLVSLLAAVTFMILSCSDNTKTYSDKLKNEKKIINALFDEKDFSKTDRFADRDKKNTFFQMHNGVLLNVVDSGNGVKFKDGDVLLIRFKAHIYSEPGVSEMADGTAMGTFPLEYRFNAAEIAQYLEPTSYTVSPQLVNSNNSMVYFFNMGLASTLNYLTDKSKVQMIVPFSLSSDLLYQRGYFTAYYEEVRFEVER